jgi:hypothetical protein
VQCDARKAASWRPQRTVSQASASSTAVSVPGRRGIHSTASAGASRSERTGLKFTNRQPAAAIAARPGRSPCSDAPPAPTCAFFAGAPPKVTNSRVCAASVRQSGACVSRVSIGAITCGSSTRPAPRLYESVCRT